MAVNQKSFWTAVRPIGLRALQRASQDRSYRYRDYLRSNLLTAEVERPSGTYIGHYHTGALYRSIKDFYNNKAVSNRRFKMTVKSDMNNYGYTLNDNYIAEPVPFEKLFAWSGTGVPAKPTSRLVTARPWIEEIYVKLMDRPVRKGSRWINKANDSFGMAMEQKVSLEATKEIEMPVEAYIDNALRSIFRGKNEKVFNRGAQL